MTENSHQLAAILFADIVGYTSMMQEDEFVANEKINRFREVLELIAGELNGEIIQYYGDGSLLLFHSPESSAKQCDPGMLFPYNISVSQQRLSHGPVC